MSNTVFLLMSYIYLLCVILSHSYTNFGLITLLSCIFYPVSRPLLHLLGRLFYRKLGLDHTTHAFSSLSIKFIVLSDPFRRQHFPSGPILTCTEGQHSSGFEIYIRELNVGIRFVHFSESKTENL